MIACTKCGSQNLNVSGTSSEANGGISYWYFCNDCGNDFKDKEVFLNVRKMKTAINGQVNI